MTPHLRARTVLLLLAAALLSACVAYVPAPDTHPVPPPRPSPSVEVGFFYGALDPYGDWLWLEPHGWVWVPNSVDPFWRPYTVGRWMWTDWGWTWVSTERWGWATYHYGRWVRVNRYGWAWVPGEVWGPGWVAWRRGAGVVGWAPLPPGVGYRPGVGLDWGGIDIDVVIHLDAWCFTDDVHFIDTDVHRYAYPVGRNASVIRGTKDATRVRVVDKRIVNEGIDRADIERAARRPVPARRVVDSPRAELRPAEVDRDEVRVYRPEVRRGPAPADPPRGIKPREPATQESPWKNDEPERTWDRGWSEDWRKLQKVQQRDAPPKAPATPPEVKTQHREENFEAAENAYKELVVERERAKRKAERAKVPPKEKPKAKPKEDPEKKD